MVHALAVQPLVDIAHPPEVVGGEDVVRRLGLLQAEDVDLLLL